MKKFICLMLSCIIAFSCAVCAFAEPKTSLTESSFQASEYPLVIVRGLDFGGLRIDIGTENERSAMGEINAAGIIKTLFKAIGSGLVHCSVDSAVDVICGYVQDLLGGYACDKNGNSVYNVGVQEYPLSLSHYDGFENQATNEGAICSASIEHYGAENTYYVAYDWRMDPFDIADKINASVNLAIEESGQDKVNIVCASMGGVMTLAYLTEYGYEKVDKCVFLSSAFCGTYVASDALSGRVSVKEQTICDFLMYKVPKLQPLWKILKFAGVFKFAEKFVDWFNSNYADRVYDTVLRDIFGTMPSFWALVLPEEYEQCKNYIFSGREDEYAGVIAKADALQAMMRGRNDLLKKMQSDGVAIAIVANYNAPDIPVYDRANENGDGTLETGPMSGGATVAKYGKTLPDDYVAADPTKLSPDRVIDASTCIFPDNTWFVKDAPHVACYLHSQYSAMLFDFLDYDGQPDVNTFEKYPQFLLADKEQNLYCQ